MGHEHCDREDKGALLRRESVHTSLLSERREQRDQRQRAQAIIDDAMVGWAERAGVGIGAACRAVGRPRSPPIDHDKPTVLAARDRSVASTPGALLLADLGATETPSHRHVPDDYPFSEAPFNTPNDRPEAPADGHAGHAVHAGRAGRAPKVTAAHSSRLRSGSTSSPHRPRPVRVAGLDDERHDPRPGPAATC